METEEKPNKVRIVIMQIEMLGGAHFLLLPSQGLHSQVITDEICEAMGHRVAYVTEKTCNDLFQRQADSFRLQLELRDLAYPSQEVL